MEDLFIAQNLVIQGMKNVYDNFQRLEPDHKTSNYIKTILKTLESYWIEFQSNHVKMSNYGSTSEDWKHNQQQHFLFLLCNQYEETRKLYQTIKEGVLYNEASESEKSQKIEVPPQPFQKPPRYNIFFQQEKSNYKVATPPTSMATRPDSIVNHQVGILSCLGEILHEQATNFTSFQQIISNFNIDSVSEKWEIDEILKSLQVYWLAIDLLHQDMGGIFKGVNERYENTFSYFEQKYHQIKKDIHFKLGSISYTERSEEPMCGSSGDHKYWMSLKGLITEKTQNTKSLSQDRNMHFLKSKLRGEAENNTPSWGFESNKEDTTKQILTSLINILKEQPINQNGSTENIKRLHHTTLECINITKNLGIDVATLSPQLVHILTQKLDMKTGNYFMLSFNQTREMPTVHDFLEFLENKLNSLESSEAMRESIEQETSFHNPSKLEEEVVTHSCNISLSENTLSYSEQTSNGGQTMARHHRQLEKNNIWVTDTKVRHPEKPSPVKTVTFQKAMKFTLFIGQCLGLNAVMGILNDDGSKLRFSYKTWKSFFCIFVCLVQGIATSLAIYRFMIFGLSYGMIALVSFYGSTCITTILFLRMANKWPALVQDIELTELVDPVTDARLKFRIDISAAAVLSLGVFEHLLSLNSHFAAMMDCDVDQSDFYRHFIESSFTWIFELSWCTYSLPLGIFSQVMNTLITINWNYPAIFIVSVSFYLTSRIEQVHKKLVAAQGKYLPPSVWCKYREDYNRVSRLVRNVDDVINAVIFASFAYNLLFICFSLFNALSEGIKHSHSLERCPNFPSGILGGYEHDVYFLFSLLYLILKSLAMSLVAARVHSASLLLAAALYDVPSPVYCVELQRFLDQLHSDTVALSGLKFFNVTRGLVLSVAGTIVTYELVLLQFGG